MLRNHLNDSFKAALESKDSHTISTLRLILAALKDRDIAARSKGEADGVDEGEILALLQTMIKQRKESIGQYKKDGRKDLAAREAEEIAIIEGFLPEQLSEEQIAGLVDGAIEEVGARGIKDMGRIMALLRARCAGRMDFAKANAIVKARLD